MRDAEDPSTIHDLIGSLFFSAAPVSPRWVSLKANGFHRRGAENAEKSLALIFATIICGMRRFRIQFMTLPGPCFSPRWVSLKANGFHRRGAENAEKSLAVAICDNNLRDAEDPSTIHDLTGSLFFSAASASLRSISSSIYMNPDRSVLLTFDVEDWFQVQNFRDRIPFSSWPDRESRVEGNTRRLLDVLETLRFSSSSFNDSPPRPAPRGTFFVLGWVAGRMPNLVREIHSRGHEVASHGLNHDLCSELTRGELRRDLSDSKRILEDIIGAPVHGYRAPNFSVNEDVLAVAEECGYEYDSSYNSFSANGRYGRLELSRNGAGIAARLPSGIYELPISNLRLGGRVLPVGGGGYFRLLPGPIFNRAARYIVEKEKAFLFYLHPWEIDPEQPRVSGAAPGHRFRHYVNLHRTLPRFASLLKGFGDAQFISCHDYIAQAGTGDRRALLQGDRREES